MRQTDKKTTGSLRGACALHTPPAVQSVSTSVSSLECACAQMVAKAAALAAHERRAWARTGPSGTNECAVKQRVQRLRKDCSIGGMYDGCKVYFFFRLDVDPAILKDLYSWQMAVWVVVVLDQGCEARRMSSPEDGYLLILWLS